MSHPFVDQHRAKARETSEFLISKAVELLHEGKGDDDVFFFLLYSLDTLNNKPGPTDQKEVTVICAESLLRVSKVRYKG